MELGELVETFFLEIQVPYRQDLIDQQNFGFHVDSNRKPQTHVHTGGIVLNRLVNETLYPGEIHDFVKFTVYLGTAHPQNRAIQIDVFPPGQFGVETGSNLQHGCHASVRGDAALVGGENLGDAL